MVTLQPMNIVQAAAYLVLSKVLRKFPDLKVVLSESGIGWIPYFLPGIVMNPMVNRYKTKDDRWLQLLFLQPDKIWADFCRHIGPPHIATDERFVPAANLAANAAETVA